MSNKTAFGEILGALRASHEQYQSCQAQFEAQHRQIVIDLDQLTQSVVENSTARASLAAHCLRLPIPIILLAQTLHLSESTLLALATTMTSADQPPSGFAKMSDDIASAQKLAMQLADAAEKVMRALYDLDGATLHDVILRDVIICHCYEHGIALPMIATAFRESLTDIVHILRQYGFFQNGTESYERG